MKSIFDLGYELVSEAYKESEILDLNKDKIFSCDIHDRVVERRSLLKGKDSLINLINKKSKGIVLFEREKNIFIGAIIINGKDVYIYTEPKYKSEPINNLMMKESQKLMSKIDSEDKDGIFTKIKKNLTKPKGII